MRWLPSLLSVSFWLSFYAYSEAAPREVMIFDVRRQPMPMTFVIEEAERQAVPVHLLAMIAWRESKFDSMAISEENWDGSRDFGVMGLNSHTLKVLHVIQPLNFRQNIIAGVGYFANLYRFGGEKYALCMYATGKPCR